MLVKIIKSALFSEDCRTMHNLKVGQELEFSKLFAERLIYKKVAEPVIEAKAAEEAKVAEEAEAKEAEAKEAKEAKEAEEELQIIIPNKSKKSKK